MCAKVYINTIVFEKITIQTLKIEEKGANAHL